MWQMIRIAKHEVGLWFRSVNWLQETSITCFVLKQTILTDKNIYSWFGRFTSHEGGSIDRARLDEGVERTAARFRANLEAVVALSRAEDFELVLVRQPITTVTTNKSFKGFTYEQEFEGVMAKLASGEWISRFDLSMIRHYRLIAELDALAARENLTLVDNIALLDEHRHLLASWVHLEPEANRMLAEALARAVATVATARAER